MQIIPHHFHAAYKFRLMHGPGYHIKLSVPYIGRDIPDHLKEPRTPVGKGRVLIPGVTGQIQLLRIAVKLDGQHYC